MLYRVTGILEPTEIERQAGGTDKVILPTVTVIAERDFTAVAVAVAASIATGIELPKDFSRAKFMLENVGGK